MKIINVFYIGFKTRLLRKKPNICREIKTQPYVMKILDQNKNSVTGSGGGGGQKLKFLGLKESHGFQCDFTVDTRKSGFLLN